MKNASVVAGGGAIDMEVSRALREHARSIAGKAQLFINAYAKVRRYLTCLYLKPILPHWKYNP